MGRVQQKFFIQFYDLKYAQDLIELFVQFGESTVDAIEAGKKEKGGLNKVLTTGEKWIEKLMTVGVNKDIGMVEATDEFYELPLPSELTETITYSFKQSKMNAINALVEGIKGYDWTADTMKRTGVVVDPNVVMTFQGTAPRTFSLAWEIVPRSREEYDKYKLTIEKLQEYSATQRDFLAIPGANIKVPISVLLANKLCKFYFLPDEGYTEANKGSGGADALQINRLLANHLPDTPGFAITNVSVTFSTREQEFRYDGTPSKFRLSLSLTERVPLYANVWKEIFDKLVSE